MDPFQIFVALGPLAVYFLTVSGVNLRRRPFLVAGSIDTVALGLSVSGLFLIGPMELFFPNAAAMRLGGSVWILMLVLYALGLGFLALLARPRLVVYNISVSELRTVLNEMAARLELEIRWAGDSISLPQWEIEFHLDSNPSLRNVSLVAHEGGQNLLGWRMLRRELTVPLRRMAVGRNIHCVGLMTTALILLIVVVGVVFHFPHQLAQSALEMFQY